MKRVAIGLVPFLLAFAFIACGDDGEPEVPPTPEGTPVPSATPFPLEGLSEAERAAYDAVLADLSDRAGEDATLPLRSIEAMEWPDACLGLPEPDEACAEVITPGYSVVVGNDPGLSYAYRTNEDGTVVRFEGQRVNGG